MKSVEKELRGLGDADPTLVAQIKVNIFNIWPKINTLISSFTFFRGGQGDCRENYDPHGLPYGLGCHSPRGLVWGGPTHVVV